MSLVDKTFTDEKCTCGRRMYDIHCTDCGSLQVEKRTERDVVDLEVGGVKQRIGLVKYRCRRCKWIFNEGERVARCNAPTMGLSVKAQRVADSVATTLKTLPEEGPERKALIADLFKDKRRS